MSAKMTRRTSLHHNLLYDLPAIQISLVAKGEMAGDPRGVIGRRYSQSLYAAREIRTITSSRMNGYSHGGI